MKELTEDQRDRLRLLCGMGRMLGMEHVPEVQELAQILLQQEADKSLRLARLSTQQDEALIEMTKVAGDARRRLDEVPRYFRCSRCNSEPKLDGTWRYIGVVPYEHQCPDLPAQCGYFPVRLIQHGERTEEPQIKTSFANSPFFKAIVQGLATGVGLAIAEHPEIAGPLNDPLTPKERQFLSDCCCSGNGMMSKEVREVVWKLVRGTSQRTPPDAH